MLHHEGSLVHQLVVIQQLIVAFYSFYLAEQVVEMVLHEQVFCVALLRLL